MNAAVIAPPVVERAPSTGRVRSIDIARGLVMVLMAIDHVRVYAGVPAGGPDPGVFFTRWVTHFCAPAFIFLAGTAAFLRVRKTGDMAGLSRYLFTRGLLLVALELTVIRVSWTFDLDFYNYMLAGVIWVIGWSMILMAGLVRLPLWLVTTFGLAMIGLHNIFGSLLPSLAPAIEESRLRWLWQLLYLGGDFRIAGTGPRIVILYSIVPWVGVMAAGYGFGWVMAQEPARRNRLCLGVATAAVAVFLVFRGFNVYGDPRPWSSAGPVPAALAFLNTAKYPASLLFLLMTLGPTIGVLPWLERTRGWLARVLEVFGRAPFFYYMVHIPLIHAAALLIALVRTPDSVGWLFGHHPMEPPPVPPGYRYSLLLLYVVTTGIVTLLYFPTRWFGDLKRTGQARWTGLF
jgi:uncharacterized membrane protein